MVGATHPDLTSAFDEERWRLGGQRSFCSIPGECRDQGVARGRADSFLWRLPSSAACHSRAVGLSMDVKKEASGVD